MKIQITRIALCTALSVTTAIGHGFATSAMAQDGDADAERYAATLQQIADVDISTRQREVMIARQQARIDELEAQIAAVPATTGSVRNVVTKATAEIEKLIESDLPFRREERFARLERLRADLADATSRDADLFRRLMTIYDVEANYGYTISAYSGNHPLAPGRRLEACREDVDSAACNLSKEQRANYDNGATFDDVSFSQTIQDGNYVHFGRMSFIYLDLDSREGFRWSQESGGWEPLKGGDIITARRAVRIARGESAPGVVRAPVRVQAAQ